MQRAPRPVRDGGDRGGAGDEAARVRLVSEGRQGGRAEQMLKSKAISVGGGDQGVTRQGESKAALAVAIANLETARLNLDYTQIRSPIDGRVGRALMTLGNNVSVIDGMYPPLTTGVSHDPG